MADALKQIDIFHQRQPVFALRATTGSLRCFAEAPETGLPAVAAKQRRLVPVEGIEPPCLAARDFESRASTSSATRALADTYIEDARSRQNEIRRLASSLKMRKFRQ
jgi:hypothetical protein